MHEAKTHLSKLIEKLKLGEEIIIAKGNNPIAKLVLLDDMENKRKLGSAKGQLDINANFDEPLDDFEDYTS